MSKCLLVSDAWRMKRLIYIPSSYSHACKSIIGTLCKISTRVNLEKVQETPENKTKVLSFTVYYFLVPGERGGGGGGVAYRNTVRACFLV